jgi:predicted DNA-binding transcriptional regulator AlpA
VSATTVTRKNNEMSRGYLLTEISDLPRTAFIKTAQAAAYIGSSSSVLLNWRSQRRGPRYHGSNDFVRYRISDLETWMSSRANEVRADLSACNLDDPRGAL